MVTSELISYIKKQLDKNISKESIVSRLTAVGWKMEDINEAFRSLIKEEIKLDPYHEPVEEDVDPVAKNFSFNKKEEVFETKIEEKKEEIKEEIKEETKEETKEEIKEETKEETKQPEENKIEEIFEISSPGEVQKSIISSFENQKLSDDSKIWTPKAIKPIVVEKNIEDNQEENFPTLIPKNIPATSPLEISLDKEDFEREEMKDKIDLKEEKKEYLQEIAQETKQEVKQEIKIAETVIEKPKIINEIKISMSGLEVPAKPFQDVKLEQVPVKDNSVSKVAMLSSYAKDYASAKELKVEVKRKSNTNGVRWLMFLMGIILIGLAGFLSYKYYFNTDNFKLSFVNEKPEIMVLNSFIKLNDLDYKSSSEFTLYAPSLNNIALGIASGESVKSSTKDSVSLKVETKKSKQDDGGYTFSRDILLFGSILKGDVGLNIKHNKDNIFINRPGLVNGVESTDTFFSPINEVNKISLIFDDKIKNNLSKVDISKILSTVSLEKGLVNNNKALLKIFNNLELVKKEERILGADKVNYYIFTLSNDYLREVLKDNILDYIINLTEEENKILVDILDSISISQIEVWEGIKDKNIYQYRVSLSAPLSKAINFEDKSIGEETIGLEWSTRYYSIGIKEDIVLPNQTKKLDDLLQVISDENLKKDLISFSKIADVFKNAVGSYGLKSNTSGDCLNPSIGSIFSPLGHRKGANTAVASISDFMNLLIKKDINKSLVCYSTPKSWAISLQLSTSENSETKNYYCVDNTGLIVSLPTQISGSVCK